MRESYDLWDRFSATAVARGPREGARAPRADSRRRSLPAGAQCHAGCSCSPRRSGGGCRVARAQRRGAVSTAAAARPYRVDDYEPYLFAVSRFTPLKRPRSDRRGAGRSPRRAGSVRCWPATARSAPTIAALVSAPGLSDRVTLPARLNDERAARAPRALPRRRVRRRSTKTTGS